MKKIIVTLTGPSLTGKSTLALELKKAGFLGLVSCTTRAKRDGEKDGEHYFFKTREEFLTGLKNEEFIEHVRVHEDYYGTSKKVVESTFEHGDLIVAVCEPSGAKNLALSAEKNGWIVIRVFLNNEREVLLKRFLERFKSDTKATVDNYTKRLMHMIEVEPEQWVAPANDGRDHYDILLNNYTEENAKDAVRTILSHPFLVELSENKKRFTNF